MPVFRVELHRSVSRVVELTEETVAYIEAEDHREATEAASSLASKGDLIDDRCRFWLEVENSQKASSDKVTEPIKVGSVRPFRAKYIPQFKAWELLGISAQTKGDI